MAHIYPQDWIYAIINSVDLPNVNFDEDIYPTNAASLRYSLDSQLTVCYQVGGRPSTTVCN
jgi:hypothetical protein